MTSIRATPSFGPRSLSRSDRPHLWLRLSLAPPLSFLLSLEGICSLLSLAQPSPRLCIVTPRSIQSPSPAKRWPCFFPALHAWSPPVRGLLVAATFYEHPAPARASLPLTGPCYPHPYPPRSAYYYHIWLASLPIVCLLRPQIPTSNSRQAGLSRELFDSSTHS